MKARSQLTIRGGGAEPRRQRDSLSTNKTFQSVAASMGHSPCTPENSRREGFRCKKDRGLRSPAVKTRRQEDWSGRSRCKGVSDARRIARATD